ncbi:MAG: alpha/beta fold hydrolase [Candidatus Polarisedimenticolia bacterium]
MNVALNNACVTFILVPGAGGSAWYWHLVTPKLQELGHEAVPVELPAADDRAGLPEYAATVVRAIGNREPRRVALVGQSLAGFTVPLVCKEVRVALLVLVNAMIPAPGETPGDWWENTGHGEAKRQQNLRDGRRADAPFDPLIDFFHDVPQPVVDAAWAQGEPRQSDSVFGFPCTYGAWPTVPTRVLVGRDDRFFPAAFQRRVARERLGMSVDEMPGGHLVALSQPAELSARLIAYVATMRADTNLYDRS